MTEKRKLFEEVAQPTLGVLPMAGLIGDGDGARNRTAVRVWLFVIFLLVAAMIIVGGLTRLTDSGLSITEWAPIHGAIPPLSDADWAEEFTKYQASPEYLLQNKGMELEDFKTIFWWEWGHRFLGRFVGLVWAVGLLGLTLTRRVPRGWMGRLLGLGALGGLQGFIGWWMVSSGLKGTMVDVASYRLATHLGLAFIILGLTAWYILTLGRSQAELIQSRRAGEPVLGGWAVGLMHLGFIQILLGALVAGIDAGRGFPTWPDMNGTFFPADAFYVPGKSAIWAFLDNPGLVQFNHRMAGYLLVIMGAFAWFRARKSAYAATRQAYDLVAGMLVLQACIGIAAALTAAHLHIAITHQIGAILLWVLIIKARHRAIYPVSGSIRKGTL
jgi:cytochrome c oxidase assembly protein subunit 15